MLIDTVPGVNAGTPSLGPIELVGSQEASDAGYWNGSGVSYDFFVPSYAADTFVLVAIGAVALAGENMGTVTPPAGWSLESNTEVSDARIVLAYRFMTTAGGNGNVTFETTDWSASSRAARANVMLFRNVHPVSPISTASVHSGNSSGDPTPSSITPNHNRSTIVCGGVKNVRNIGSVPVLSSFPAGFTLIDEGWSGNGFDDYWTGCAFLNQVTAALVNPGAFDVSWNQNHEERAYSIALRHAEE